jgi:hypothetical protein
MDSQSNSVPTNVVAAVRTVPFPKIARAGGNMKYVKESSREIQVQLNQDDVAEWVPKTSYALQIGTLKRFIENMPSEAKFYDRIQHPLLHISGFCMSLDMSKKINDTIYGHRKQGNKAFSQLLSYLGMRSHTDKKAKLRILKFDPEAWNRMGVRLIKGGDSKGGRPKIVYQT